MIYPDDGLCWQRPELLDFFFSDDTNEQNVAKHLCYECPVQFECLQGALERNERFGIFGGLLPSERKRLPR